MSIMEPCGFNCEDVIINLKKDLWIENSTRRRLLGEMRVIVQFVFSKAVQDCMEEFNKRFISKVGNVAYNRTMLLGIYFYCFKRG